MRVRVIFASLLMMSVSLAGCITDSTVEEIIDEITEIWGCMDESSLNYDETATNSSDLCLSEEQLSLAEDVFWSSWDADAVNNATEPVGYRLMLEETSEDENESRSLDVQEVFSSDYYDKKILLRIGDGSRKASETFTSRTPCAPSGLIDEILEGDKADCLYSSQTVFDNLVQVEKYSGEEWDNYSMDTASTYDAFRNSLEHGPGIRSSYAITDDSDDTAEDSTEGRETNSPQFDSMDSCVILSSNLNNCFFPTISETEFESIDFKEVETRGSGRSQTIYYFARDTSTGNEVEVMGEMTENGFKITEYCNEILNTNVSITSSYMGIPADIADGDDNWRVTARIILLEMDGDEMYFEEYDYAAPIKPSMDVSDENGRHTLKAIPFYFEGIPDNDDNESENKSATEGKKGLNAVNVKVVIAGPSGPYGMEGDLSDYRLVTSNCTLDNATTGVDESTTSARSESTRDAVSGLPTGKRVYGSDGNTCTNIDVYDLSDIDGLLEHGITFVDADSSGTLSEGDRFEFSENYTCVDCDEANMLRLYSINADEFSDGNINPSSEMSSIHEGAMNSIRNIRAVVPDDPPPLVRAVDHNTTRSNK